MSVDAPLLEIDGLVVEVRSAAGARRVVDEVDLVVRPGEPMGLVGESGSGKSVILRAIMGLLPRNLHVVSGSIKLRGVDVLPVGRRGRYRAEVRGRGVSMIFQEPSLALHPVLKVGRQICDSLIASGGLSRRDAWPGRSI
jgi:ABC-type dipeptide/oligopeptide/nickel transport system ATPase component